MKINSRNRGFAEGTMVLMADGSQKAIENIKTGDLVLSFDEHDADAPLEPMRVLDTFERIDNNVLEVTVGNTVLKVAQDQMFIGPHNDWKQVYNHSRVVDVDGNSVNYSVNKISRGKHRIYDITVDENHSLIANGIRVHNIETSGTTGSSSSSMSGGGSMGGTGRATSGGLGGFGSGTGGTSGSYGKQSGSGSLGGSKSATNNKSTNTTKDSKQSNNGGGGKTNSKSSNAGGGGNLGGGNKGNNDGNRNQMNGNGQNSAYKKNNGQKGYSKKKKGTKDEPDPVKPSGVAVSMNLISAVNSTAFSVGDLIDSLDPNELKTFGSAIQDSLDIMYSFAESMRDSVLASEMSSYDKSDIMNAGLQMLKDLSDERKIFDKSSLSASDKKMALMLNTAIEDLGVGILARLNVYATTDTRGGLEITVNGNSTAGSGSGERPGTYYRRDTHGKYVSNAARTKERKQHRIRGKKHASSNN